VGTLCITLAGRIEDVLWKPELDRKTPEALRRHSHEQAMRLREPTADELELHEETLANNDPLEAPPNGGMVMVLPANSD